MFIVITVSAWHTRRLILLKSFFDVDIFHNEGSVSKNKKCANKCIDLYISSWYNTNKSFTLK